MPNVSYLLKGIVHLEYHQQPLLAHGRWIEDVTKDGF
jgi:hypothetical protein